MADRADRLVLRDISAKVTLAGARVVTLNSPRRGKRKAEYLAWIAALALAYGAHGEVVESTAQFGPALARAGRRR